MYANHSSYLAAAFEPTNVLIEGALKALKDVKYDTMVGTGTSGLLVIPLLARTLDKKFAIVRKENDDSHREYTIEGVVGNRWIFVDDFISSGATRRRVRQAIEDLSAGSPKDTLREWPAFTTRYIGTYEYYYKRFIV